MTKTSQPVFCSSTSATLTIKTTIEPYYRPHYSTRKWGRFSFHVVSENWWSHKGIFQNGIPHSTEEKANNLPRKVGFIPNSLKKIKIPFEHIVESGVSFKDGQEVMEALIHSGLHFDTIFCFTENAASIPSTFFNDIIQKFPKYGYLLRFRHTIFNFVISKMTAIEQTMRLMAQKICGIDARKLDIFNAEKQEIFLKAKKTTR